MAARGRLSAAAVHASGARRCARAHLYFAAGSLQPRAGLMLAPPLRHRELVDWPLEKQAHFSPSPLVQGWEPSLQARRRVETRELGRGKGPQGPRVLTPGSPRYPVKFQMELSGVGVGVGKVIAWVWESQDWVFGGGVQRHLPF